jgi:hypothetical protein
MALRTSKCIVRAYNSRNHRLLTRWTLIHIRYPNSLARFLAKHRHPLSEFEFFLASLQRTDKLGYRICFLSQVEEEGLRSLLANLLGKNCVFRSVLTSASPLMNLGPGPPRKDHWLSWCELSVLIFNIQILPTPSLTKVQAMWSDRLVSLHHLLITEHPKTNNTLATSQLATSRLESVPALSEDSQPS